MHSSIHTQLSGNTQTPNHGFTHVNFSWVAKKKKNVDGALDVCYDGGTDGTFLDEHFRFLNDGAGLLDPISSELTILVFCNRNICL